MLSSSASGLFRLNPYSNGMKIEPRFSKSVQIFTSLNPYSNGMKIELTHSNINGDPHKVLILILME